MRSETTHVNIVLSLKILRNSQVYTKAVMCQCNFNKNTYNIERVSLLPSAAL